MNATTLGKSPKDALPFNDQDIKCAALICDVITLETPTGLNAFSKSTGKATVSRQKMDVSWTYNWSFWAVEA